MGFPFQDTLNEAVVGDASAQTFSFNAANLFRSLNSRTIVPKRFRIEVIPEVVTATPDNTAIVFWNPGFTGVTQVASGPYKILSKVNPTQLDLDVTKLARVAPAVMRPITSDSTDLIVNLRFAVAPAVGEDYRVRITSWCHVLPQIQA